jgi:hypothetical protein
MLSQQGYIACVDGRGTDLKVLLQKSGLKKRIRKYEVDQIDAAKLLEIMPM